MLGKRGFQLRKLTLINLRGQIIHPLEVAYTTGKIGLIPSVLMDIPVSKCRTQLWNTLEESKNPFVKTIVDYSNNKASGYDSAAIKAYYKSYVPNNACEVLRLSDNEVLKQIPAHGYLLPWDNQTADEIIKTRERVALNENRQEGKQIDISAGYTDFGPVDTEKGEIEFKRLVKTFENIKKQGYIENPYLPDGAIKGYFLIGENNDWCFIVKSGKHRAYALSAIGYQNIPVVVDCNIGMVKRVNDLRFWPHVNNGIFSKKEAYTVANKMLDVANQG
ncbi:MAG TPA: hypothetical protein PL085_13475 [Agriterribacter sp.]|uniref:hypothetical protein n=1 Tax=Agriterribacter sp. TaxID=2821509 RepID=UPI002C3AB193|nr:hypothetical protein [Agriterribacter sp.]HRQ18081.1 hypothetical protein [Agriterribacter sp.]